MIKKRECCKYCGEKMDSKTAKKEFCSDTHRVYWNREKPKSSKVNVQNNQSGQKIKPPREVGENYLDYLERINGWDNK